MLGPIAQRPLRAWNTLMPQTTCVAVLGAGIMGHGIAQALAGGGARVLLADRDLAVARGGWHAVEGNLDNLVDSGHCPPEDAAALLSRITAVGSIQEAAAAAQLVVEAVPEVMSIKHDVLRQVAAVVSPETIIATNTSSFDIDDIAAVVHEPSLVVGSHWYNPAYLVPCVEVVRGTLTSDETTQRTVAHLREVGKLPVLAGNRAGFVGNRLQFALVAEAFRCVEEGVATAADVDTIVRTSFGMRLAEYGPFQLADMGGLDTYQSVLRYLTEHLGDSFAPTAALDDLVQRGRLGLKSSAGVYDYTAADLRHITSERDHRLAQQVAGNAASPPGGR